MDNYAFAMGSDIFYFSLINFLYHIPNITSYYIVCIFQYYCNVSKSHNLKPFPKNKIKTN